MEIRLKVNGQIVSESGFRNWVREFNLSQTPPVEVLMPDFLTAQMVISHGGDPVLESPAPSTTEFQRAVRNGVVQDANGNWTYAWKVENWTQAEIDAYMAQAKASKNVEINEWRLKANRDYFVYQDKHIACDELSRSDIDAVNGALLLLGDLPPNWIGYWKTMDNSLVSISTKADWIAFYMAMVQRGQVHFATAQSLKTQLAAATTLSQIAAITWP